VFANVVNVCEQRFCDVYSDVHRGRGVAKKSLKTVTQNYIHATF